MKEKIKQFLLPSIIFILSLMLISTLFLNWSLRKNLNKSKKEIIKLEQQAREKEKELQEAKNEFETYKKETTRGTSVNIKIMEINKEKWLRYTDNEYGFIFKIPYTWGLGISKEQVLPDYRILSSAPPIPSYLREKNGEWIFSNYLTLSLVKGETFLTSAKDKLIKKFQDKGNEILEVKETNIANYPALVIKTKHEFPDKERKLYVFGKTILFKTRISDEIFELHFSYTENYKIINDVYEKILENLEII